MFGHEGLENEAQGIDRGRSGYRLGECRCSLVILIVKEESKESGMIVPTWWYKEEGLRNMRTWGHLDSTLKSIAA